MVVINVPSDCPLHDARYSASTKGLDSAIAWDKSVPKVRYPMRDACRCPAVDANRRTVLYAPVDKHDRAAVEFVSISAEEACSNASAYSSWGCLKLLK
jgi:hypothetical protein